MNVTDTWARISSRALLALAIALGAPPAFGQAAATDRATAEALFREAKRLMGKKKFAEACPKLEESQRLDPQGGTLLNLAVCHAREGKTASAWAEFQEALALARDSKRADRIRLIKRELGQLSPRLSHLVVQVSDAARVPGLEVRRGATVVGQAAFGVAVPVDPGSFEIIASAPGYRSWTTEVVIAEAERSSVDVPPLEKLPKAPERPAKPPPLARSEPADSGESQRLLAYAVGGVGLVALGVGGYFGWRAIDKANQSEEHCTGSLCDPEGLELNDEADKAATVSNVALTVGIVGVGVGTYLFLSAPRERDRGAEEARARRNPKASASVGARGATVLISGVW